MTRHILHTVASTEVDTWQRTHNLAVLIAERCAPNSQNFVDYQTHKTEKMLTHVKFSSKSNDYLKFLLIFAMSLMIFACIDLQH